LARPSRRTRRDENPGGETIHEDRLPDRRRPAGTDDPGALTPRGEVAERPLPLDVSGDMSKTFYFKQGKRCGHIEGRGRAGQYVIGEEWLASIEAADNQEIDPEEKDAFASGYREGYLMAAEGTDLPVEDRLAVELM
jgi:hypothetical protein